MQFDISLLLRVTERREFVNIIIVEQLVDTVLSMNRDIRSFCSIKFNASLYKMNVDGLTGTVSNFYHRSRTILLQVSHKVNSTDRFSRLFAYGNATGVKIESSDPVEFRSKESV